MRIGLVVTKRARKVLGDQLLLDVYKASNIPYVAELGDYLKDDIKENELQGLLIVSENDMDELVLSADEKLGINPLAIDVLPLNWFLNKNEKYSKALLLAYISKLSKQDNVYRLRPVKTATITKRALIKFRLYEYKLYPILFDSLNFEREVNTLVESCPKGLIAKSVEGVTVTSPSDCSGCGYCTAKGYLGYFELPNFTTEQFVSFLNEVLENYEEVKGLIFTSDRKIDIDEESVPLLIPSVASIHDSFILSTYASGLIPIIVVPEKPSELEIKRLEELPSFFPGTKLPVFKVRRTELSKVKEDLKGINLPKSKIPEEVIITRYRRRSLLIWSIEEMGRKVVLDPEAIVPGVYYVEVDPNKCVMCGVCIRMCQMMVPDMKTINDLTYLEYNVPMCIGSQRCVRNCPENAIKVERFARIKELSKVRVNEGKVVRCRYCGKPVGNIKIKGRVDNLLVQYGFTGTAQYTDVCNECKQKVLTKMWLENYLRLKEGMRK